jgi:cellulose 1,4-beta-cellobiosidase
VGAVTTATLSGLSPTGEYQIWVSATDREGNRSSSNRILVATPAVDTGPDTTIPSTPTGLRATSLTPSGVTLVWDPATDNVGVTGYNVYKYDGMYSAARIATVTGTTYSGSPATGSGQFFFVRARDAAGNLSLTSNTAGNASGLPPSSTPPPPAPTCRVTYQVTSQWRNGFVANLTIANTGTSAVNDWTLNYAYGGGQKIITSWSGTVTQSGSNVAVKPVRWTRTIAAGGHVDVGILGTLSAGNPPPTAFTLNGAPCATG